jgi:hypothetical protein
MRLRRLTEVRRCDLAIVSQWVEEIVLFYVREVKLQPGLPDKQCTILYVDCWSVHRSEEFRHWIRATQLLILLIFVPATCTGILHPAEVGLQRVVKHRLKPGGKQNYVLS